MKHLKFFLSFTLVFVLFSCEETETVVVDNDSPVFTQLAANQTGIDFVNTTLETVKRNLAHYDYFYNGSGVGVGDINNDGLVDIFFAGNHAYNKLYLNEGDFKFKDISKQAKIDSKKWATGVTMVDINNDGYLDIYVCSSGPYLDDEQLKNVLYINNGDLTFTESAEKYGIADNSYATQSTFFDMDQDGDLDLFVLNHSFINYGKTIQEWENAIAEMTPDAQKKMCNTLYRNDGNGKFVDISKEAGIYRPGFSLGVAISDFNEDGLLDIYVTNDYFIPDFMYFNNGDGTFSEGIKDKVSHSSFYAMGCDAADFNNDGLVDLMVVDMTPADHYRNKTLMESMDVKRFSYLTEEKKYTSQFMYNTMSLNRGKGNFSEIAHLANVAQTGWSWAPLFADFDNDTQKDLVISNGFKRDTKNQDWKTELQERFAEEGVTEEVNFDQIQKAPSKPLVNYIYQNEGHLSFKNKTKEWGFKEASFSNGAAYADFDNDGDIDLVFNNLDTKALLYRNNTMEKKTNHFIQFVLTDGGNKASVMHAKVKVYTGNITQVQEYSFTRGYMSNMHEMVHFGLGKTTTIDKVEIIWPDGKMSVLTNLAIDKRHEIDKKKFTLLPVKKNNATALFMDITAQAGDLSYVHKENDFDDFKKEILLPHKQSTLGPCISAGDVNGDGFQDFYVGGGNGQPGELYIQGQRGLVESPQQVFLADARHEDLGSLFFDADGDGDLDLYVASGGGGDFKEGSLLLQDRLYLNDGGGNFVKSQNKLPKITASTSVVEAADWDGDGDIDLFVGGRTLPGKYPLPPTSYLLQNNKGTFTDVTEKIAPKLRKIGMVTGATWSDINKDGRQDLMLVGEWMPITTFVNTTNGFENTSKDAGFAETTGWWYSIEKGDFDNDGDEDFIVGNIGQNNKFHPKKDKPLHVYASDFDKSGTIDIVLSKMYKNNLVPVRGKECSTEQMPFIKNDFPTYASFASSTINDIFGEEKLSEALHYEAVNFSSMYIENKGDGTFLLSKLPAAAQISPINGIVIWDFDKDGNLDAVIGGNAYNTEVETPAYDAGKGLFLKGNGNGTFSASNKIVDSGIFMPQNVKGLELFFLSAEKRPAILTVNNNSAMQLFVWTR